MDVDDQDETGGSIIAYDEAVAEFAEAAANLLNLRGSLSDRGDIEEMDEEVLPILKAIGKVSVYVSNLPRGTGREIDFFLKPLILYRLSSPARSISPLKKRNRRSRVQGTCWIVHVTLDRSRSKSSPTTFRRLRKGNCLTGGSKPTRMRFVQCRHVQLHVG